MTTPATERLRVGFLTPWNIDDPRAWSGIIAPMFRALSEVCDVVPICTHDVPTAPLDRALARGIGTLTSKSYLWDFGLATAARRGRIASRRVRDARVDAVFAVAASVDVAFLGEHATPVVQYVDTTFESVRDVYPVFAHVDPLTTWQITTIGRRADRRTARFVAASDWALRALATDHAIGTECCVIAPPGAAITPPENLPRHPDGDRTVHALVVASDWERKGGDRALNAVQRAREAGTDIDVTIVGDAPAALPEWAHRRGRLSAAGLSSVYADADVLLELARANAAGVTLTDAAAHGLPAIATATMGVPSIVADRRSGWLIRPTDDVEARAADVLVQLDRDALRGTMRHRARQWYDENLSWPAWAGRVHDALVEASGASLEVAA